MGVTNEVLQLVSDERDAFITTRRRTDDNLIDIDVHRSASFVPFYKTSRVCILMEECGWRWSDGAEK